MSPGENMDAKTKRAARVKRHRRVRKKVTGTAARPRLAVFRSNKHIYAQLIDDGAGHTLVAAASVEESLRGGKAGTVEAAQQVGKLLGDRASQAGIKQAVFDRGGFHYHGQVAAVAEAVREAGVEL